jgi:hypothetical protein
MSRQHYLFAQDINENGIGDGKSNLLQLWLKRRKDILKHESIHRFLISLWDLATKRDVSVLNRQQYTEFFERVAKALVDPVSTEQASSVAQVK